MPKKDNAFVEHDNELNEVESLRAKVAELTAALADASRQGGSSYVPKLYPAMRYRSDGRTVRVEDESADKDLGEGWHASPQAPGPNSYPAWRYHSAHEPRMVKNADEDASLGAGWKKPEDLS